MDKFIFAFAMVGIYLSLILISVHFGGGAHVQTHHSALTMAGACAIIALVVFLKEWL